MKKAALIEGLWSFRAGYVRRVYKQRLERLGYKVDCFPYNVGPLHGYDLIIAHSFGGGHAIKKNHECKILITMDARLWRFWLNSRFKSPAGSIIHYNFYQTGFVRGYPVKNAKNKRILNTSHVSLPATCFNEVMEFLK